MNGDTSSFGVIAGADAMKNSLIRKNPRIGVFQILVEIELVTREKSQSHAANIIQCNLSPFLQRRSLQALLCPVFTEYN